MSKIVQDTPAKVFFPNLDGLRTIAFLFVYVQHGFWGSFQALNLHSGFLNKLVYEVVNGGNGVSIFFVLSGFLITYLLLTEAETKGKIHVWYFYIRRVLRIWPLYFAVVIFAVVLYPYLKSLIGMDSNLASRPIYYFTFLSNFDVIHIQRFHPGADAAITGITWSVAIEEQFYLLWPLLFVFTPRRYYKFVFLSVIAASLFFRLLNRHDGNLLYFHSLGVCADLAIGGFFAWLSLYSEKFQKSLKGIGKFSIIVIYLIGLLWMLYGSLLLNSYTYPLFFRLINTLFFAFIILEQNFSIHSFFKFSQNKVLTYWGKYTYGLYLLHPIALLILDISLRAAHIPYKNSFLPYFTYGLAGLALSLLISYWSYELFEKRFLWLKEKFSFVQKQTKVLEYTETEIQENKIATKDQVA